MVLDELEPIARRIWLLAREQTADWATAQQDEGRLRQLLLEKQSDSQTFFASAAARWDRLRDELYGRGFTTAALMALLPAEWAVADLACGTGQASAEIARSVAKVIGVDNSAAMLKAARRRMADLANVDLRRGDLEALPIADAECDAAVVLLALTYVPDPAAAVREMSRVIKPGGRVVIVDLLPHDREDFRVEMGQARRGLDATELERHAGRSGIFAGNEQAIDAGGKRERTGVVSGGWEKVMGTPLDIDARKYYRVGIQRLKEAELILAVVRLPAASTYLTGYAVECVLKSTDARQYAGSKASCDVKIAEGRLRA